MIRRSSKPKTGDIVAATTDGEYATLKRLYQFPDHVELRPENPEYTTFTINRKEFDGGTAGIIGVVTKVLKENVN